MKEWRKTEVHIHACWRDKECQEYGAPKRLYINTYFGSLQIEKWSVHFHRADRKREREWMKEGIKSGKITFPPGGGMLVKLDKPIVVKPNEDKLGG